jgi:hypothetical protein
MSGVTQIEIEESVEELEKLLNPYLFGFTFNLPKL